jgi:hypothetical protein
MTEATTSADVQEARRKPRFNMRHAVPATFAGQPVTITNLSADGLGVIHASPIRIDAAGSIRIESAENFGGVSFRGRIRWSRLSRTANADGKYLYHSGLRIEDPSDAAFGLLGRLIRALGEADRDSLRRKLQVTEEKRQARNATPVLFHRPSTHDGMDQRMALIRDAQSRLANHPESAQEWYNRAKYSLVKRNLMRDEHGSIPFRREVIVIWEFLGGKIDLETIATVLDGSE